MTDIEIARNTKLEDIEKIAEKVEIGESTPWYFPINVAKPDTTAE